MNKVYNVSYDLKKQGQDYNGLIKELKNSPEYWHYLGSTWLISTTETADQLWSRLAKHIDGNDYALIMHVTRDYSGWLPQDAWTWIQNRI